VSAKGTTAYFWDPGSNARRGGIEGFRRTEFSPDGTKVAVLLQAGAVEICNASGGTVLNTIPAAPGRSEVTSMAFSWDRDSKTLAMGLEDGSIAIYSLSTDPPRLIYSGKQHDAGETQVVFSPDRKTFASAGKEGHVVLWNASDWQVRHQFSGKDAHSKPVLRLAFSPDGRWLASGSEDKSVALLDVAGKRFVARFEPHDEAVDILVFIEDGKALVSGKARGWPEVWDVSARRWLTSFRNPGAGSGSVAVSPQGRRIALLHEDGLVTLRDWDRDTLVQNACRIADRNLTCAEWRQYMGDRPYHGTCETLPEPPKRCR
ncbi:MAG TPA: hypothetical protein VF104_08680, partial [Burkholderiales bacterium]